MCRHAFDALAAGETATMTVSYTMQDTAVRSRARRHVTINGADDLPARSRQSEHGEDAAATS